MIVVKVGGSLYDHPRLFAGLRALTASGGPFLLVPGGGPAADAVRGWQRAHGFGDAAAHWLALRSLTLTAHFLASCLPAEVVPHPTDGAGRVRVLDPFAFCHADDELPHTWDVTSDSIAARAAIVAGADKLILLKSIDIPLGTPWAVAASNGWVDPHFPLLVSAGGFHAAAVNLRAVLASLPDDAAPGKLPLPPADPGP